MATRLKRIENRVRFKRAFQSRLGEELGIFGDGGRRQSGRGSMGDRSLMLTSVGVLLRGPCGLTERGWIIEVLKWVDSFMGKFTGRLIYRLRRKVEVGSRCRRPRLRSKSGKTQVGQSSCISSESGRRAVWGASRRDGIMGIVGTTRGIGCIAENTVRVGNGWVSVV